MGVSREQITEDTIRRLFYDLEALIEVLKNQVAMNTIASDNAMRGLNAAQVTMAPGVSNTIVVNGLPALGGLPTATFLIENTSLNLMQVTFTNDDVAIPVYIGDDVHFVIPAGDLLDPRQRITYILRRGQKKFGLNNSLGGTVNVIVNQSASAYGAVTMDAKNGEIIM
jgi:hypothetical protein